jgi:hypothetical protein
VESDQFDALVSRLSANLSRRRSLGLLGALSVAGVGVLDEAEGRKKKKKKGKGKGKGKTTLPPPPAAGCGAGGPCRVFLSSTRHSGNLGGLGGADAICQGLATTAGLPGTYKAWLSDSTSAAGSRFVPSPGPYQLVNGTTVAATWADLTDGTLLAPINVTETGGDPGGNVVAWTGTLPNGNGPLESTEHCANWSTNAAGNTNRGRVGFSVRSNTEWTSNGYSGCDETVHLYCFQQS